MQLKDSRHSRRRKDYSPLLPPINKKLATDLLPQWYRNKHSWLISAYKS